MAFRGIVDWPVVIASVESGDNLASAGVTEDFGSLAGAEGFEAAAISIAVAWIGAIASSEIADVAGATGGVIWTANLAAVEGADVGGSIPAGGIADFSQAADSGLIGAVA